MNGFESSGVGYGSLGFSSFSRSGCEDLLLRNEKQTIQNLNERLASYLEKVHSLEELNSKLELKIKTFFENKSPMQSKDTSDYFKTISDLHTQISSRFVQNAELYLQIDFTRMAAADIQNKYETEKNMRTIVEADLPQLRGVMGEIKLSIAGLENHLPCLKEELLYLKKTHEKDLHMLRGHQSGSVNVEIDSAAQSDLGKMLEELRSQYETLVKKNRREFEQWYKIRKPDMEDSLFEVSEHYSAKLGQLQLNINVLQEELQGLNTSTQEQATEYQLLLDIKMRLELEIAEYKRLLGGEEQMTGISTSKASLIKTEMGTRTEIHEEIKEEVHEEIKEEVHEEIKEEVHEEIKEEVHEERKEEVHEEIKEEVHEEIKEEVHDEIKEEVHEEIKEEVHEEIKEEVHEEIKEEVHEEIKEEVHEEIKEEVHAEIKEEVHEEIKEEVHAEIKEEVHEEIKEEVHDEIKEEIHAEIKKEIHEEIQEKIQEEIKEEVHAEIKEEIHEEIQEEIKDVHIPHLQRRVKVIVEKIVDGKIVSICVTEKVQDLNSLETQMQLHL